MEVATARLLVYLQPNQPPAVSVSPAQLNGSWQQGAGNAGFANVAELTAEPAGPASHEEPPSPSFERSTASYTQKIGTSGPRWLLGSASTQGARPYMEDCHAVHMLHLMDMTDKHSVRSQAYPVGHADEDETTRTAACGASCGCFHGLFRGKRDEAAAHLRDTEGSPSPRSPAAAAAAHARFSTPEPSRPAKIMRPADAVHDVAAATNTLRAALTPPATTHPAGTLPVPSRSANTVYSRRGQTVSSTAPFPAQPSQPVSNATSSSSMTPVSTPTIASNSTNSTTSIATKDNIYVVPDSSKQMRQLRTATCDCGLQPAVHAGEECLLAQVYDGHGGHETARFAALNMVHFVARACQQQLLETNSPSSGGASQPAELADQHGSEQLATRAKACVGPTQLHNALHAAFAALDATLGDHANAAELYQLSLPECMPVSQPCSPETASSAPPNWYGRWYKGEEGVYVGPSAGSTAVVALLSKQLLTVAGVGDSRAWICTDRSVGLQSMSVEHKPTEEGERQRIFRAGGWVSGSGRVNSDLDMSRSLGDMEFKQAPELEAYEQAVTAVPDVMSLDLSKPPGSNWLYLLLCTDGLSNACSEAEIHAVIMKHLDAGCRDPGAICNVLCSMACEPLRTVFDNVTAMLILPSAA